MKDIPDWAVTSGLKPRQGVGLAFAEERPLIAADYTTDDRFETTDGITGFVQKAGIRAVLAARSRRGGTHRRDLGRVPDAGRVPRSTPSCSPDWRARPRSRSSTPAC